MKQKAPQGVLWLLLLLLSFILLLKVVVVCALSIETIQESRSRVRAVVVEEKNNKNIIHNSNNHDHHHLGDVDYHHHHHEHFDQRVAMPAPVLASPLFPESGRNDHHHHHEEDGPIITNNLEKLNAPNDDVTTLSGTSQTVSSSVNKNSWNYYKISFPSRTVMTLSFTTFDSITVYVKEGSIPSSFDYDYILLTQYSVKTIVSTSLNQTTTFYIGVASDSSFYSYSSYTLSISLNQGIPNWVIGVIIGSVIFGLCVVLIIILVPILICCGVCAAVTSSGSSSQPKSGNTTVTTYHVKTPILTHVFTPPQYHTTTHVVTPPPPQNDPVVYYHNNANFYPTSQQPSQPYNIIEHSHQHDIIYNPNMPSQAVNYHKI